MARKINANVTNFNMDKFLQQQLKEERQVKNEKLVNAERNIEEQTEKIETIKNQISKLDLKRAKIELELNQVIDKMWEEYELTYNMALEIRDENLNAEADYYIKTFAKHLKKTNPDLAKQIK